MRRGLAVSRAQAVSLVQSGRVLVAGSVAGKPSRLVSPAESLSVSGEPPRFVGRGGDKLAAALDRFGLDPGGRSALDVGASTGGFTDCLLQRGAVAVTALDVGRGQLHERLRQDARVHSLERTDIRSARFGDRFDLVVGDVSFISLRLVAGPMVAALAPGGDLVVLVKPQFEVGRHHASQGRGVIRDPDLWRAALESAITALEGAGATMMGAMVSPLLGADGNVEFLVHFRVPGPDTGQPDRTTILDAVVSEAVRTEAG